MIKRRDSFTGLMGINVVDIVDYNQEVHDYLITLGAKEYQGYIPAYAANSYFKNLSFQDRKPVKFHSHHENPHARIFFASNDDALLFSVVFGHKIFNSYVREIKDLLDQKT